MNEEMFFEWQTNGPKGQRTHRVLENTLVKVADAWFELFLPDLLDLSTLSEDMKSDILEAFITGAKICLSTGGGSTNSPQSVFGQLERFAAYDANSAVYKAFFMGGKLALSCDGWQIPVNRAYTTGAFIEPLEVVDAAGKKVWRWVVTGFEDDTYYKGVCVLLKVTGISPDDLVEEIPV